MELTEEVGFVISCNNYLLYLEGLPNGRINDVIISAEGGRAIISALEDNRVEALMLDAEDVKPGDLFRLDQNGIRLPLGNFLMGRTISPLGAPLDGKTALPLDGPRLEFEATAAGISHRKAITEPFYTGVTLVDTLIPIGKGQRELIVGEARSGKSTFLLDAIANQKNNNVVCIYAAIGKPEIDIKRFANAIRDAGGADYTIVLAATSNMPSPAIVIAPEAAFSIAEFYCRAGRDVLLIVDDLGVHSKYLREIALLSRQIPGRESYPGSIFYQHSHLMERAGRFREKYGATITLLPVIEIGLEDLTNLIPTNLMSQTDGHILFSASLNAKGQYPAIEWPRSVTRVGRQTQMPTLKLVGGKIKSLLSRYLELEVFSKFDAELSAETRTTLRQAELAIKLLSQEPGELIDPKVQTVMLGLVFTPYLLDKGLPFLVMNKEKIKSAIAGSPELLALAEVKVNNFEEFIEKLKEKTENLEKSLMGKA